MHNHDVLRTIFNEVNNSHPSRETDALVAKLIGEVEEPTSPSKQANWPQFVSGRTVPHYTSSIGDAIGLAHDLLVVHRYNFSRLMVGGWWYVDMWLSMDEGSTVHHHVYAGHATESQALVKAIILALIDGFGKKVSETEKSV